MKTLKILLYEIILFGIPIVFILSKESIHSKPL